MFILFFRAHASFGARAGSRGSSFAPAFFEALFEIGSHGYEHRDPGLHNLSLCTRENLTSRDGSGSTFSVPYMILSTRGNYSLLEGTRD